MIVIFIMLLGGLLLLSGLWLLPFIMLAVFLVASIWSPKARVVAAGLGIVFFISWLFTFFLLH